MYVPTAFAETRIEVLHDFMQAHSFGMLVTMRDGTPFVTHLPLLLERDSGPQGSLIGHMARANPQWQDLLQQEVLAVFTGPHAYISPAWYEAEDVVPTWNYVAVHACGWCQLIEDPGDLASLLARTVEVYERHRNPPWKLETGTDFFTRLARQVVGFRLVIHRLEGKWKLSQNQPPERRDRVIRALRERGEGDDLATASLMEQRG